MLRAISLGSLVLLAGCATPGWFDRDPSDLDRGSLPTPNVALMEQLARQTGGAVLSPDDLAAFARDLPTKRAPVTEAWTRPLWHTPWMFAFALACFTGEWGLRRWKGLA